MTRPDERAMLWIRDNTNPEDRFLVNSFFAYGGTLVAGSDGGWWLPLLTERLTSQPPLNYGVEEGLAQGRETLVNVLPDNIMEYGLTSTKVMEQLRQRGFDYIYIGQQQGRVNSPNALIDKSLLQINAHFQLVYSQDCVKIYKITY